MIEIGQAVPSFRPLTLDSSDLRPVAFERWRPRPDTSPHVRPSFHHFPRNFLTIRRCSTPRWLALVLPLMDQSPPRRAGRSKGRSMSRIVDDVRYAIRSLRKAPLFTAIAVISMSFGIAANTAVFTLVDQVILRQLPVEHPKTLVQVAAPNTESYGGGMGDGTELSYSDVQGPPRRQSGLRRHVLPHVHFPARWLCGIDRAGQR